MEKQILELNKQSQPTKGEVLAKFAFDNLRLRYLAVMLDSESESSFGVSQAFVKAFKQMGGKIAAIQNYVATDSNFFGQLSVIKGHNPDGIFIPDCKVDSGIIAQQAKCLGLEVPILRGNI